VTSSLDAPELQSASISGVDLEDLALVYSFVFDEDVDEDTVQAAGFKLYAADTNTDALGDTYNGGDDIDVDGEVVAVTFNLADAGVASATLAAVIEGAVEDEDGNINPPQSVSTSGIGNSSGPGLVSVEITDEEEGIAEFTFGSPQMPGNVAGTNYQLIARDGTVYSSTAAETSPDDEEPSTVLEIDFGVDLSDDAPSAAADTIRRAAVDGARVHAVDIGSGATDGPDLASIQTSADDEDLADDEVRFIFDEAIDTAGADPDSFALVYATGCDPTFAAITVNAFADPDQDGEGYDDVIELAGSCVITANDVDTDNDNNRAVIAEFLNVDVVNDLLVAAFVSEDAGVTSDTGAEANANDEVEVSTADDLFTDGEVLGPQLTSASLVEDTNVFGDFTSYVLTLTFDKDLDDAALAGDVKFWYQSGEDVENETMTCEIDDDNTIVCEDDDEDSELQNAVVVSIEAGAVTGADSYDVDNDAMDVQFVNPEASIEVSLDSDEA
jgi:hypothetical protein